MSSFVFQAYGPSHLAALGAFVVLLLIMNLLRRHNETAAIWVERSLGLILLSLWALTTLTHWQAGSLTWQNGLPLHLCDIAGIAGGIALWTRRQFACEIVYFFGLAGTLQGLITPNLEFDFPDPRFLVFFLLHGGVVVTALHVVTAMRHAPSRGAIKRMMIVSLGYALLVTPFNLLLGTNYGFLRQKPQRDSLMNYLGPEPWHVIGLVALAMVFYSLLYLPFVLLRRRRHASA